MMSPSKGGRLCTAASAPGWPVAILGLCIWVALVAQPGETETTTTLAPEVLPGKVDGWCNETVPCGDQHAGCDNNTCVCQSPYQKANMAPSCVIPQGKVGGQCMVNSTTGAYECEDVRAFCQYMYDPDSGGYDLRCTCRSGYNTKASDLTCEVLPGKVGGWCDETSPCEDEHASCVSSTCVCKSPYQSDTSTLGCEIPPGKVGTVCYAQAAGTSLPGDCEDAHAHCDYYYYSYYWWSTGQCSCNDGYQARPSDLTCVVMSGKVDGWCDETSPCEDQHAACENNTCVCQSPYQTHSTGFTCVIPPGKVGGVCDANAAAGSLSGTCEDAHAYCWSSYYWWRTSGQCTCRDGYQTRPSDLTCEVLPGKVDGWCNEIVPCEDQHAGCDNNTCVCQSPYQKANMPPSCVIPQGKAGGLCMVNSTTGGYECEDVRASCQYMYNPDSGGYDMRCTCRSGYNTKASDLTCGVLPGKVGGWCDETSPCEDQHAGCENNACVCQSPYEAASVGPTCVSPQGKVGGECVVNSTTGGYFCEDVSASCQTIYSPVIGYHLSCTCNYGYAITSDFTCEVLPGKVGGWCNETSPCEDQQAGCDNNTCVCQTPYQADISALTCVSPQGKVGGECMVNSTTGGYFCEDVSASCQSIYSPVTGSHLRCTCNYGYAITSDFTCEVIPGKVGGWCNETSPCEDQHAGCDNNTCVCQTPYKTDIATLTCVIPPGKVGGVCNAHAAAGPLSGACEDAHAYCWSRRYYWWARGQCSCRDGYQIRPSDLTCEVLPGKVGGWCNETSPCEDQHASCVSSSCVCESPYQSDTKTFTCVIPHGKSGGVCYVKDGAVLHRGTCEDAHAHCVTYYYWWSLGQCSCNDGYQTRPSDLACVVRPGKVRGFCDETLPCEDHRAACDNNTCVCQSPYQTHSTGLTCVIPQGKVGGLCMVNSTTGGYECEDVRAWCEYMYSPLTGGNDWRCTCNSGYKTKSSDLTCELLPGKLGGWCDETSPCVDQHASCVSNTCVCESPYQSDTSTLTCVSPQGKVGGSCIVNNTTGDFECEDVRASCHYLYNPLTGGYDWRCTCNSGYNTKSSDLTCDY